MTKLMGLPWGHLGPLLANISYLSFHETIGLKIVLSNSNLYTIGAMLMICLLFIVFKSRDHILPFLNYLNSKHTNISLSHMRLKKINVFPFLM